MAAFSSSALSASSLSSVAAAAFSASAVAILSASSALAAPGAVGGVLSCENGVSSRWFVPAPMVNRSCSRNER